MVSIIQKTLREKKIRNFFKKTEEKRRYYKFIQVNSSNLGYVMIKTLAKKKIKNFCLISGHPHSVYSKNFRLSRHQIKKYFSYITGLRNSSW